LDHQDDGCHLQGNETAAVSCAAEYRLWVRVASDGTGTLPMLEYNGAASCVVDDML
jgi:hypothetical protein